MELAPQDANALLAALQGPAGIPAARSRRLKASESSAQSASRNANSTSKTTKETPVGRRSSTPTRDKETVELRALRAVEQQLQSRLSTLRTLIKTPGNVRGQQAVLRYVARRQLALRRASERTNRSLREQIAAQHRSSRELMARIAAQLRTNLPHSLHALGEEDRAILTRLASVVDRMYDLLPSSFPNSVAAKRDECTKTVNRFLETMSAEVIDGGTAQLPGAEIGEDRELPFDFYSVITATWSAITAWHAGGNGARSGWTTSRSFLDVERPEHTLAVRVGFESENTAQLPVFLSEMVVIRRYIEPGRFVVVWLGSYDGEDALLGSKAVQLGWIIVEQQPVRVRLYGRVIPTTKCCEQVLASSSTQSCREDLRFIYRHMTRLLAASSTLN